jgi:heme oxygenase (biliverdin-IX-beta and delta-forming)
MDQSIIDIAERKKQFFQRVKAETADLHRQTESSRLSVALMSENLSEKSYVDYLLRMKEIVEYYEKEIFEGLAGIIPDIGQRRKLPMIKNDLAFFNIDTEKNKLNFSLPPAGSDAMLLGYMYVLEGSSLGGAMIYKQVSRKINISEQQGGAYFTCYGSELSSKWKSFLDILGDHGLQEKNAQEIIAGARIAFQHIAQHLG